jgi:transposase-like protein
MSSAERVQPATPGSASENFRKLPIGADSLIDDPLSLNEAQRAAIELLLTGRPFGEVAQAVGVTPRTLYTWRHRHPDFRRELRRRRLDAWEESGDRFRALLDPALRMLEEQITNRYDRHRYQAAATILRLANVRSIIPVKAEEEEDDLG